MMDFLKKISLAVCVLSLVHSFLMILAPEKYKKQIKTIISILVAITIGGFINGFSGDMGAMDLEISHPDFGYDRNGSVINELNKRLEEAIKSIFDENGIAIENISVSTDIDEDNCIFISKLILRIEGSESLLRKKAQEIIKSRIGDVNAELSFTDNDDGY